MQTNKRVYVAGSITSPDSVAMLGNLRRGIEESVDLLRWGLCPFCPFIDFQFFLSSQGGNITSDEIKAYSIKWLEVCGSIYVLSGSENSKGTQAELVRAKEISIPIFYDKSELLAYHNILFKTW